MKQDNAFSNDNITLAVLSVVLAVLALSFGDAVIKGMSVSFSLWQIYVIRSVIAICVLAMVFKIGGAPTSIVPKSIGWTLIRSLLLGLMWIAYYASLPHIKLSVAAAVYYTIPLFITLFSALFTRDKISKKSWFSIALGFAGVIVIVRPDVSGFNAYVILPLIAAILYALAMILTRTKCVDESPKTLSLSLNLMFILMGVMATVILQVWHPGDTLVDSNPFLWGEWIQLDVRGWLAMTTLGVVTVIGSIFAAIAYQKGPPTIVASFDYSYLAFSVFWGFVFFTEVPDALTVSGMVMIVVAGLISVRN